MLSGLLSDGNPGTSVARWGGLGDQCTSSRGLWWYFTPSLTGNRSWWKLGITCWTFIQTYAILTILYHDKTYHYRPSKTSFMISSTGCGFSKDFRKVKTILVNEVIIAGPIPGPAINICLARQGQQMIPSIIVRRIRQGIHLVNSARLARSSIICWPYPRASNKYFAGPIRPANDPLQALLGQQ